MTAKSFVSVSIIFEATRFTIIDDFTWRNVLRQNEKFNIKKSSLLILTQFLEDIMNM